MDEEATPQSIDHESEVDGKKDHPRDSEVDFAFLRALEGLDPGNVRPTTHSWVLSLLAALVLVALTAGITRAIVTQNQRLPKVGIKASEPDLLISSFSGDHFVLLVGEEGVFNQIKLTTATTNTVNVRDLAQGTFSPKSAALDAQRTRVAYIGENNGHRYAVVVDLSTGASNILDNDKLKGGPLGKAVEPCTWSPISWSPIGDSFAFFGCDRSESYLIVVRASTQLSPFVIRDTASKQPIGRQVFWIDEQNLIFSSVDPSTNRGWIGRVEAKIDAVASPIFLR